MNLKIEHVITNERDEQNRPLRQVRSFVRRQGRFSEKQSEALDKEWTAKGIDYVAQPINFMQVFNRDAPMILEIGFGMGRSLVSMAQAQPENNFLGIEVHLPGVGACLALSDEMNVNNLRVMRHDAIEVLENCIADNTLQCVQIFFPDPWQKVKHRKRRIIQVPFVELIYSKLANNGILHLATDWQDYANHMLKVMNQLPQFCNLSPTNDYIPRPESRPLTKFEARGKRLGHKIWDLQFYKKM